MGRVKDEFELFDAHDKVMSYYDEVCKLFPLGRRANNFRRVDKFLPFFEVWEIYDYELKDEGHYFVQQVLRDNHINAKYIGCNPYIQQPGVIVEVKVPKRQRADFIKAMGLLQKKMMIIGYRNYATECDEVFTEWEGE